MEVVAAFSPMFTIPLLYSNGYVTVIGYFIVAAQRQLPTDFGL
jgi:hypothetical protein